MPLAASHEPSFTIDGLGHHLDFVLFRAHAAVSLPVPGQAFRHHFYFAPAGLRLDEDREFRGTALTIQDRRIRGDKIIAVLGPSLRFQIRAKVGAGALYWQLALEAHLLHERLVLNLSRVFG